MQRSRILYTFAKNMNKLISTKKNRTYISLVGPSDSGKKYFKHEWLKVGTVQPTLSKLLSSNNTLNLSDVMQKENHFLEFVQGLHFEFINCLKNNGVKYQLIFDESCAEICNSKEFVDIATTGRYCGFSTI